MIYDDLRLFDLKNPRLLHYSFEKNHDYCINTRLLHYLPNWTQKTVISLQLFHFFSAFIFAIIAIIARLFALFYRKAIIPVFIWDVLSRLFFQSQLFALSAQSHYYLNFFFLTTMKIILLWNNESERRALIRGQAVRLANAIALTRRQIQNSCAFALHMAKTHIGSHLRRRKSRHLAVKMLWSAV